MSMMRWIVSMLALCAALTGCSKTPKYGVETQLVLPGKQGETWAIAPVINLSGQKQVDPLLEADLVYQQVQQVGGLTVIPVNRVVEVYAALRIEKIENAQQANLVCDLLGCQGLIVPTVTIWDPYNPPKIGASLQLFGKAASYVRPADIDPRELARQSRGGDTASLPPAGDFLQAVGMYDAANGSTRDAVAKYAAGRNDPVGPLGAREYLASMDRYAGFAWYDLTRQLLDKRARMRR